MLNVNEFNLTHFERIIQNQKWINLQLNKKILNVFYLPLSF